MLDDDVLLAIAAVLAVLVLARSARSAALREAGQRRGWLVAAAVALLVSGALARSDFEGRGWVGLGVAVLLLVVPARLSQWYFRLVLGQRYRLAGVVSAAALLLHPTRALLADRRVLAALRLAARGDGPGALARFDAIATDPVLPEPMRLSARAWAGRVFRDWPLVLTLPDRPVTRAMRLRAYGETGQAEALVAQYQRPGRDASPLERLMLLAFCGRPDAVERLVSGPLDALRPDTRAFWVATARYAGGDLDAALAQLRAIPPRDEEMRQAFADRLARAMAVPMLTPEAASVVDGVAAEALAVPSNTARPWATYVLLALNVGMFAVELGFGDPTDTDTLFQLGGLWPPAVTEGGEAWRIGSAMFLHAGFAHLAFNMAALAAFGSQLERRVGHVRFVAVYAGAGLLSMASVVGLAEAGAMDPSLLVGASGAIMGLVGAMAGFSLRAPTVERGALRSAALVVGLQAVFDLLIPQVSFAAHASGAVAGFGLALLLPRRR